MTVNGGKLIKEMNVSQSFSGGYDFFETLTAPVVYQEITKDSGFLNRLKNCDQRRFIFKALGLKQNHTK